MGDIEQFIDGHTAEAMRRVESQVSARLISNRQARLFSGDSSCNLADDDAPFGEKSLSDVLRHTGKTFQQRLFELIDASGMDDVTVYKKANIDRKLFSHIRSNAHYKPKKKTAVAFAIALELDLPTTRDLLQRAEIAFSESNPFDLIIEYFINQKNYDIFAINAALFQYGQPTLGV